ncbi:helicase-related protein [Nocardioides convexus]|uniref:helicase-related protein n=1 Tax=Nocardioides convexus TaxID=2712224 RepID=UPI0024187AF0|nr:helicase-related protein [Nocardioides convexus]
MFTNGRRTAERLTARLNEIAAEQSAEGLEPPAQIMAQSGASAGAAPVLARTHHGSVSKEQRAIVEDDLKAGRLPAVVATSSLELGIDMGAVDLVLQIASPPSVASALQRVGRAGHQVGETSRGIFFPQHRGDLAPAAVAVARMRTGGIEELTVPANPLDVLAQQVVAATAVEEWDVDESLRRGAAGRALRPPPPLGVRRGARTARRPLPQRRVRRVCAPGSPGTG